MLPNRRGFLFGAGAVLAAPAIVRVSNLMPVSTLHHPEMRHPTAESIGFSIEGRTVMWVDSGRLWVSFGGNGAPQRISLTP